jgi:hypothetical protein
MTTITVTASGDTHEAGKVTLREALIQAKSGDTIKLITDVALLSPLAIGKNVTIDGSGGFHDDFAVYQIFGQLVVNHGAAVTMTYLDVHSPDVTGLDAPDNSGSGEAGDNGTDGQSAATGGDGSGEAGTDGLNGTSATDTTGAAPLIVGAIENVGTLRTAAKIDESAAEGWCGGLTRG